MIQHHCLRFILLCPKCSQFLRRDGHSEVFQFLENFAVHPLETGNNFILSKVVLFFWELFQIINEVMLFPFVKCMNH